MSVQRNGTVADTVSVGVIADSHSIRREIGCMKNGWGWQCDGYKMNNGCKTRFGIPVQDESERLMVALDLDRGNIWFGRNGDWFESGDPVLGTHPAFSRLVSITVSSGVFETRRVGNSHSSSTCDRRLLGVPSAKRISLISRNYRRQRVRGVRKSGLRKAGMI